MNKKALIALIITGIFVFIGVGFLAYYFLVFNKVKDATVSEVGKTIEEVSKDMARKNQQTEGGQYKVLYGKTTNSITSQDIGGQACQQFTMIDFLEGGSINGDGTNNLTLKKTGYPMSYPSTDLDYNYYYLSTASSPYSGTLGVEVFDWDKSDQEILEVNPQNDSSEKLIEPVGDKFPGALKISADNKYLVYVMSKIGGNKFAGGRFNPNLEDSDLIVRDLSSGEERTIFEGNYNRALFSSFSDFSVDGGYLFTIKRQEGKYEFVRVSLADGQVQSFDEVFPTFDWSKTRFEDFFGDKFFGYPSYFYMSPDETTMLASKNIGATADSACSPSVSHELWAFDINQDQIKEYSKAEGMIDAVSWNHASQAFSYAVITGGGCYPEYLDAFIFTQNKNGQNKQELLREDKSKIVNLGYSPNDLDITYDVYSIDMTGRLKTVNVGSGDVMEIINTLETEGSIDQEKPVTLHFLGYIETGK